MYTTETSLELNSTRQIPVDIQTQKPWQLALKDFKDGLKSWRIWLLLAWQDIRLRYRRSTLGPFWLTLSMAITIYAMGFLYGHLFHMDLKEYYPFLAAGMLAWNLINVLIVEGSAAFTDGEDYLKQMKIPFTVFPLRIVSRSLIIFAHYMLVIIPIWIIFKVPVGLATLLFFPGLFLLALSGFFYGVVIAMIAARYSDFRHTITSLMQVIFFMTPIMWGRNILPPRYQFVTLLNPFAQYLDILRMPLLGQVPSLYCILSVLLMTMMGALLAFYLFCRARARIIYWL